ncbi:MAG: hypothetical protein WCH34_01840 [Bacteroidota bacterium]
MGKSVYPTDKMGLYFYFLVVIAYIIQNATRLLVSVGNLGALAALYGDPSTEGTYMYYFTLWSDTKTKCTSDVITNLATKEKQIKKLLSKIFNDIPGSIWTDTDRSTFNRKTGLEKTISHPTKAISKKCYATVIPLGDGAAKFECRTAEDSTRPSLPELANGVELAYRIDLPMIDETTHKIKRNPINGPDDGTTKISDTKASFTKGFGGDNAGCILQGYTRWINTVHSNLNGLWTGPFTIYLS